VHAEVLGKLACRHNGLKAQSEELFIVHTPWVFEVLPENPNWVVYLLCERPERREMLQ
jgi:hypothetical protein